MIFTIVSISTMRLKAHICGVKTDRNFLKMPFCINLPPLLPINLESEFAKLSLIELL
jgi:hypothetical protein